MHKGRSYPYLFEFWQARCYFWPGFVPLKLHVQCAAGYGSSWDRLAAGIITDVGVPDALSAGDPLWSYADPGGAWNLAVLIHDVALPPAIHNTISVRVEEVVPVVASLQFGDVIGEQRTFGGWTWHASSFFPPFSLGLVVPLQIRPATWSEI